MSGSVADLETVLGRLVDVMGAVLIIFGVFAAIASMYGPYPKVAAGATTALVTGYGAVMLAGHEAEIEDWVGQTHPVARLGHLAALVGVAIVPLGTLPGQPFRPTALAGGFLFLAGVTLAMAIEQRVTDSPADVDAVPDDPLDVLEDDDE